MTNPNNKLLILVGSANRSRSMRNPFTFEERKYMIEKSLGWVNNLYILPLDDFMYNDTAWVSEVQYIVNQYHNPKGNTAVLVGRFQPFHDGHNFLVNEIKQALDNMEGVDRVALAGFDKDASTGYLKMFPEWEAIEIKTQHSTFNSTNIRHDYFRESPIIPRDICPPAVVTFLKEFMTTKYFYDLVAEGKQIKEYKKSWSIAPYPPIFSTVDAVVVQSGHILLVTRKDNPGKGLLALPGGFLQQDETIVDGCIRELKEETDISDHKGRIPPAILKSYIKKSEQFDDPNRSERGRTITTAFLLELPPSKPLYHVKGMDDAEFAQWVPIGSLDCTQFFEDHYFIIQKMLGLSV